MANNALPAAVDDRHGLYERDYYRWAVEQARALKEHRTEALDWKNLAEEVKGLGRSERRELRSRLTDNGRSLPSRVKAAGANNPGSPR